MAAAIEGLWESLKHSIEIYTGLSPAAFFTAFAVAVALYHLVAEYLFKPPPPPPVKLDEWEGYEPLPPPVQLGEVTEEELKAYDGSDPKKPLLMAIKGQIYDVTQSRMFYGPGGPYALFAGKDASRALAKMSFEPKDLTADISGLGSFELEALQDWEYKFMSKYVKVGTVKTNPPATEEAADSIVTETSEITADVSPDDDFVEIKENDLAINGDNEKKKLNGERELVEEISKEEVSKEN
ncbi:hypothetical protein LUZ60_016634 [Juncus effusus]|nr:hypothetical protein LUZ60_016634 [Juncus effusus]